MDFYVLMAHEGRWDDATSTPIALFANKERADRIAAGFNSHIHKIGRIYEKIVVEEIEHEFGYNYPTFFEVVCLKLQ